MMQREKAQVLQIFPAFCFKHGMAYLLDVLIYVLLGIKALCTFKSRNIIFSRRVIKSLFYPPQRFSVSYSNLGLKKLFLAIQFNSLLISSHLFSMENNPWELGLIPDHPRNRPHWNGDSRGWKKQSLRNVEKILLHRSTRVCPPSFQFDSAPALLFWERPQSIQETLLFYLLTLYLWVSSGNEFVFMSFSMAGPRQSTLRGVGLPRPYKIPWLPNSPLEMCFLSTASHFFFT